MIDGPREHIETVGQRECCVEILLLLYNLLDRRRAAEVVNVALFDMAFLKYPASLQAVTALLCEHCMDVMIAPQAWSAGVMRELKFPNTDVRRFIERVKGCKFPYQSDARAEDMIQKCGTRVFGCIMRLKKDVADDAEGVKAISTEHTTSTLSWPIFPSKSVSRQIIATSMPNSAHSTLCVPFSNGKSTDDRKNAPFSTTVQAHR